MDLRERIAAAITAAEESHPLIAERFRVSVPTVERISRRLREGSGLKPRPKSGRPASLQEKHLAHIRRELERDPFMSSYELARRFKRFFPKHRVHRSTILRAMHDLGFSFKKNSVRPPA
ncbi:MAG: hypothetical protein GY910_13075 [bacterium]|nr:hypothetical protein [bacterium]